MTQNLFKKDLMFFLHLLTRLDVTSEYNEKLQKYFTAIQTDKMNLEKTMYRFVIYFKNSNLSKEEKITNFHELEWIDAIKNNEFGDMLNFVKNNDFQLLPDVPISHFIKDRIHQMLCWNYLLGLCFISEITLLNNKNSDIFIEKISNNKKMLLDIMRERLDYEKQYNIDSIIDKEIIKAQGMTKEGIQDASSKVKEMFDKKGGKSAKIISSVVEKLSSKLQESVDRDEDGPNMFSIIEFAKEIAKELSTEINPGDINPEELLKMGKDIGKDMIGQIPENEKNNLLSNPMMAQMLKAMNNPEEEVDLSSIEKLAKENGIDPEKIMKQLEKGGNPMDFFNLMKKK